MSIRQIRPQPSQIVRETKPSMTRLEPIYVRIDKYENSLATLQDIKKRLMEIESLLNEARALKAKEEMELTNWEQEIQDTKNKLDSIDRTIFSKLE